MNTLIKPLADIFKFNSVIVQVATQDLQPGDAFRQIEDRHVNPIFFQLGHLANSRHHLAKVIGVPEPEKDRQIPNAKIFDAAYDKTTAYPEFAEIRHDWERITNVISEKLETLTDSETLAEPALSYPFPDKTVRGAFSFLMWHESYHVGQIGIVRRVLGYKDVQHSLYDHIKKQG